MIRRNVTYENDQPAWLLISQVEHARVSGELAEHWGCASEDRPPGVLPLADSHELLPAVYHHDDGWQPWELAPQVDPQTGLPLAFTEMPLAVALHIWRGSIERAQSIGPLAAWVVASHFVELLGHSHEAENPLAIAWLQEYDSKRLSWLQSWLAASPVEHTPAVAEQALHQLQLFDRLSLWLCMAERTSSQEFTTPGGPTIVIAPGTDGRHFTVNPWPLLKSELALTVTGRIVPARAYSSSDELAAVPQATQTLTWSFTPQ